jgi:hypothetical protein
MLHTRVAAEGLGIARGSRLKLIKICEVCREKAALYDLEIALCHRQSFRDNFARWLIRPAS